MKRTKLSVGLLVLGLSILPLSGVWAQNEGSLPVLTDAQKSTETTPSMPPVKTHLTEEQRQERFKQNHPNMDEKMRKMTPEQREKFKQKREARKEKLKNMSPEERKAAKEKHKERKAKRQGMSKEERHQKMKEHHESKSGK